MDRREFLKAAVVSGLAAPRLAYAAARADKPVVNDVSRLNPVEVAGERRPPNTDEVRKALRSWSGAVSLGGGRFSMGGQIAAPDSLHLDLRGMNRIVAFEPRERMIRIQAGMTGGICRTLSIRTIFRCESCRASAISPWEARLV